MKAFLFLLALGLAACGAPPPESVNSNAARIEIRGAWAPPTPGGVSVSGGYLAIVNHTDADERLLSVSSPRAVRAELHEMTMDGAVMRMREVEALPIPAGETVQLAPGGMHLMFFGVAQPFVEGEEIPATLSFEHAGDVEVALAVRRGS